MRERACKNCGGKNYEVVGQNMVKCLFCGTLYVDEQASKDEAFLIARANDLLRELQFEKAEEEFDKVISLYPMSFEAFFGRALAKNKIVLFQNRRGMFNRPSFFGDKISFLGDEADFQKALSLAPQENAKTYNEIARRTEKIKKNYDAVTSKRVFDCVVSVIGQNEDVKQAFKNEILKILNAHELSVFDCEEFSKKQSEESVFRALETSKVFVFCALDNTDDAFSKTVADRYFYQISQHHKTKSSFVLCLDSKNMKLDDLPKEFSGSKNVLNTFSISFAQDLEVRILKEIENSKKELAKIDTIQIQNEKPQKRQYVDVESVEPMELGHYEVENISGSSHSKKKWIFISLKNGDFATAQKLTQAELEKDPYDSELLFAQLLSDKKIRTEDEFFSKISNFSDRERLENILRYANKGFAENFVDRWEMLVQELDEVEFYNNFLLYLASFKTPNRENFILSAENKAVESLDETLISNVEKCFDAKDVDRFVQFYFLLAQKSDDKEYYSKILQLDMGHEESNIALMLRKFKTSQDKLSYRNREEVENMLKFLNEKSRTAFVSAVIEMIVPVAFLDLEEAQKQIDFYVSYIQEQSALCTILQKLAFQFQEMGFFKVAEKYISIAISKENENKVELYWKLIQIKCHCRSDEELIVSKVKPSDLPEWETLLELGDDAHDEMYGAIVSKNSMYEGEKNDLRPDLLDKVQLKEKLSNFLLRNRQVLLEIEKQDGLSSKKGTDYFQMQLQPFEKYINELDRIEDFDTFVDFIKKIDMRLFAMGLSLESSISAIDVAERSGKLSNIEFSTSHDTQKMEKVLKSAKKSAFLRRFLIGFLEFFPLGFATLLLIVSIAMPKEVYLYFSQTWLIVFMIFSACVAGGNLLFYTIKKRTLSKKKSALFLSLIGLGVMNLVLFLLSFYIIPTTISISNSNELQTLLKNAPYHDFVLEKDVDLSKEKWEGVDFYGSLDGKDHKISNIKTAFLSSNHGELKNLTVEVNMNIKSSGNFGVIAGQNFGVIENCFVTGELSVLEGKTIGGIVGDNRGSLISCQSSLKISVQSKSDVAVGGVVGANQEKSKVAKSAFVGEIEILSAKSATVGGLNGKDFGKSEIFENFSNSTISVSNAEQATVGGLVGLGRGSTHDNYALGKITTSNVQSGHVGGLYGDFNNSHESVLHSYCSVEIETSLKKGALVGALSGMFDSCFAKGQGELCGEKRPPISSLSHCELSESYDAQFGFDTEIWDLSQTLPKLAWEILKL